MIKVSIFELSRNNIWPSILFWRCICFSLSNGWLIAWFVIVCWLKMWIIKQRIQKTLRSKRRAIDKWGSVHYGWTFNSSPAEKKVHLYTRVYNCYWLAVVSDCSDKYRNKNDKDQRDARHCTHVLECGKDVILMDQMSLIVRYQTLISKESCENIKSYSYNLWLIWNEIEFHVLYGKFSMMK